MQLQGSKTEENLKAAFAGESQANRRYLYFANKADIEGQNDVAALFRSTAEGGPATPTATWSILKRWAIRPAACRSALRATTLRPQWPVRHTSTPTCIRAWPSRPARKALTRSPTGSRPWPKPSARMPTASRRGSTHWSINAYSGHALHAGISAQVHGARLRAGKIRRLAFGALNFRPLIFASGVVCRLNVHHSLNYFHGY